jgi:hypothetical protein
VRWDAQRVKVFENQGIEKEFKAWFSVGSRRGRNHGVSFQRDLYTNIWCLKLGIQLYLSSRASAAQATTVIDKSRPSNLANSLAATGSLK